MKNRVFHYFLLTLLAISCVKEQQEIIQTTSDDPVFYATVENAGDPETRVYVDDKLRVLWNANDRVSIFNKYTYNQEYRFSGEDGDNSGSFYKVQNDEFVTGNSLDYVYSVYPHHKSTKITNDGQITVYLPAEQSYRENSFGQEANTMISATEDNQLLFKNLCGYLSIKLYGDNVTVASISLKGNNNEPLSGKAFVTASVGNAPSMSFDASATNEITLSFDSPITLGATTETATNFWLVVPPTTFSKGITLTVKDEQNGVFEKSTTKSLAISRNMLSKMSPLEVSIVEPEPDGLVDLGLSVKWATCNLGASSPEEFGDDYPWGEVTTHFDVMWGNYSWCKGTDHSLTKYCCDPEYGYDGFVDYKTILDPEDDVASVLLGSYWRMPTAEELKELINNCTWELATINTREGVRAISKKNGASLFFPVFLNQSEFFSSSLLADHSLYKYGDLQVSAIALCISKYSGNGSLSSYSRISRRHIRPVFGKRKSIPVSGISLDKSELTIPVDRTKQITATVLPENATEKFLNWESSNSNIATVSEGAVTAHEVGQCIVKAISLDGKKSASCIINVVPKSDPSFYSSTDYSKDGEVVLLHKATVGRGINLILLGDGFVDTTMTEGGTYDQRMSEAMNQFFSYDPYKTFKNRFNLYYVRVVSTNSVYGSEQSDRKLSYNQDQKLSLRSALCFEYAEKVPNPYKQPLNIAVLFNTTNSIGRSFCLRLGEDAVCFILGTEENIINHELGGHAFAHLADEYVEKTGEFSDKEYLDQEYNKYGYNANVDWRSDPTTIRWSRFLTDNRYLSENLGIYEGAYLYPYGVFRSTDNSVMRYHHYKTGKAFNAPSREQIYKTIMKYSEGEDWVYDYETFVRADEQGRREAAEVFNSSKTSSMTYYSVNREDLPHPPVMIDRNVKEVGMDKDGNIVLNY